MFSVSATYKMSVPPYEKLRMERMQQNQAELESGRRGVLPLQDIQKIARDILYGDGPDAQQRTSERGDDDVSDPEYEPDNEEEANAADEVAREEEEATLAMSKSKVINLILHIT